MVKNILKNKPFLFSTATLIVGLTILVVSIVLKINSFWLSLFIAAIPLVLSYVQFVFENVDEFLILWNKLKCKIRNPSLEWKMTALIKLDAEISLAMIQNFFASIIEDNDFSEVTNETPVKKANLTRGIIVAAGTTEVEFVVVGDSTLKISCSSKFNYRDSKEQLEEIFTYFLNKFKMKYQQRITSENYSLKVTFSDKNPFYGLYVKRIQRQETVDFHLSYEMDQVNYTVSNRTIEATSKSQKKLKNMTTSLLVLGDS